MATATKVQLTPGEWPIYYREGITTEPSQRASDLLQENHEQHHIFVKRTGFHNHIAHHLLTLWALKGSTEQIQSAYDHNKDYQGATTPPQESVVLDMHDRTKWKSFLGNGKYYNDFLQFFQDEIKKSSWQEVVQKYVFAGDERANDILVRLFAGFLHPIIHLGFGIEFQQPSIMAEGLAQAAVHDNWIGDLFWKTEEASKTHRNELSKGIAQLLEEIHADKELSNSPHWSDGNKIRDGVLARAGDRMAAIASQFHLKPADLAEKTAEMINVAAYYAAGAQRNDHVVKYDFYFMHCVNSSIFFSAFLKQDWLSEANKVRLLEWKVWLDLAMYASRKSPDIRLDIVRAYKPNVPSGWDGIQDRVVGYPDDGHAAKLVRALAHGQVVSQPYEDNEAFRIKQDDWLQMGHMAIDSVEAGKPTWVKSAGFDEAWEEVPRAQL
ncbi:oxidoreductase afly [Acrodontium crateriforme]|uniref:Oxidoreductase afly n=1 Tax=Acrodontium crateriforme TaxID=150365 RepID=A0AAQ3RA38_9PEZI|nr:oxidoreductase afly [Acrodontium crateriforme]